MCELTVPNCMKMSMKLRKPAPERVEQCDQRGFGAAIRHPHSRTARCKEG